MAEAAFYDACNKAGASILLAPRFTVYKETGWFWFNGKTKVKVEGVPAKLVGAGEFDFSGYPGKVRFRCRIDRFAVPSGGRLQFELPDYADLAAPLGAIDNGRRTPAQRSRSVRNIVRYRIEFPDGFRVAGYRPSVTEAGRRSSGYFTEHFNVTRNRISLEAGVSLPVEMIQPADYVEIVDLDRLIRRPAARTIVLSPANAPEVR